MNQSTETNTTSATPGRIAFIQARWHAEIVDACRISFLDSLKRDRPGAFAVDVYDVPGAFEIPLLARRLAGSGKYAAVVGCAFVVDGGIYRHDFVAQAVISGLMQAQMESDVPVLSAVLTPHQFHESAEHRAFFLDHFRLKGREVAAACLAVTAEPVPVAVAA
ncbi:6,7-dimethyl-8-ribityllumazine synthase [Thalassobaculum sp.]|uniref:6,7-dimethyl-8-ribityllumazine synthase n=1 Tax=Thalassobaculum sp. TaxID=2022740 RepID=UPI003B590DFB